MNNKGITKENLLRILPPALTHDPSIVALAEVSAEALAARLAEIDRVRVISNIDELDEAVLDILARDFKVDWWDPRYSIAEKRRTLKGSWRVHKTLGTKAAVETAIRAIYPETSVEEWFEYKDGKPYHFKLHIDLTGIRGDDIHPWSVLERVNYYKSLRSHLDRIEFTIKPKEDEILRIGGCLSTQTRIPVPELADSYDLQSTIRIGGAGGVAAKMPLPELEDSYDFQSTVRIGGAGTITGKLPVPETADSYDFQSAVRIGGAGAITGKLPVPETTDSYNFQSAVRIGGAGAVAEKLPVPETADSYDLQGAVRIGGAGVVAGKLPVPETADNYDFQGTVHTGGTGTAMSRMPVPEDSTTPLTGKGRTGGQPAVRFTLPVPELE